MSPMTIFYLILGYVLNDYMHYHILPKVQEQGIKMVLEGAASEYKLDKLKNC